MVCLSLLNTNVIAIVNQVVDKAGRPQILDFHSFKLGHAREFAWFLL